LRLTPAPCDVVTFGISPRRIFRFRILSAGPQPLSTTPPSLVIEISAASIQGDYAAITRGSLPLDQATTIAHSIGAGTQTESGFVNSLFPQAINTTVPAVAVEATMYGMTGSSNEITSLATQFLPPQIANANHFGFNPQVYASEALGLLFAFGNETGSTAFADNSGPSHPGTPNSVDGDNAFSVLAATTIFGSASRPNLVNAIEGYVTN
jgi:hypothetical protein